MAECATELTVHLDLAAGTVRISGHLDRRTAAALFDGVLRLTRAGHGAIDLDVRDLASVDACGVTLLLALQHTLSTHSRLLCIRNAHGPIADALAGGQVMVGRPATGRCPGSVRRQRWAAV
ncbi:MAG TPA: STAS domain-containing protein [Jatrophihabitans sp.]|nr:STAS domain-containing protein [Jatrophihabitans sp.]